MPDEQQRPALWKPILIGSIAGAITALAVELLKRSWDVPTEREAIEVEEVEELAS